MGVNVRILKLFGGICKSIMCYIVSYSIRKSSKVLDLRWTLSIANGVIVCKESYPLLLKCFKTFLTTYARSRWGMTPNVAPPKN